MSRALLLIFNLKLLSQHQQVPYGLDSNSIVHGSLVLFIDSTIHKS